MFELSKTIKHGDLTIDITVRPETGFDTYVEKVMFNRIYELIMKRGYALADWWTPETQAINEMIPVINRTVTVTGIPIAWPNARSDDKEICAAWEYLKEIPGPAWEAWTALITKANEPPGDPDLVPPEALPESKKKTQK